MRVEKEHDQQAATAVNKYYQVLSLRDITQEWSPRPTALSVKSMEVSLTNKKNSYNPTLWPFNAVTTNNSLSPNVTPNRKPTSLPLRRKQGFDLPVPFTLEPNVRVIDETRF